MKQKLIDFLTVLACIAIILLAQRRRNVDE